MDAMSPVGIVVSSCPMSSGTSFHPSRRRRWAGKGVAGPRPALQASASKVRGGRLFLLAVADLAEAFAMMLDRLAAAAKRAGVAEVERQAPAARGRGARGAGELSRVR
jgi:hypothetical protein